jgi:L-fuculose-phosphate aldolase
MLMERERTQVVSFCRRMEADQLTVGTSGNISVRSGDLIAITPSAVEYRDLTPAAICVVDLDGSPVDDVDGPAVPAVTTGSAVPSSELPMHTSVYRATDAGAVVHTHPLYATALSLVLDEVPPVHYMLALLGGQVRVAPYARFGSEDLAEQAVRALQGRYGVLLRNHGATTYGATLAKAYSRSVYLEWVCRLYQQARLLGEPALLPVAELDEVAEVLRGYGRPRP